MMTIGTLLLTAGVALGAEDAPGSRVTPAEVQEILRAHNEERARVGAAPLVWDAALAGVAQRWADRCRFAHNPDRGSGAKDGIGENLAYASPRIAWSEAVKRWADERRCYDPDRGCKPGCAGGCGHYTQIVWSITKAVGCGARSCTAVKGVSGGGTVYVCDYRPAGNVVGRRPH
jgi:hypothetical protein